MPAQRNPCVTRCGRYACRAVPEPWPRHLRRMHRSPGGTVRGSRGDGQHRCSREWLGFGAGAGRGACGDSEGGAGVQVPRVGAHTCDTRVHTTVCIRITHAQSTHTTDVRAHITYLCTRTTHTARVTCAHITHAHHTCICITHVHTHSKHCTHTYTHQTHTPCTCNAHPPCIYTHAHMHSSHIHQVSELFRGSLLEPTFLFYSPAGVEGKVQTQGLKVFTHRTGFLPRPSVFGSRSRGVTHWGSRFSAVKQNPSTSRRKRQSCEWRPVRGSGVSANACFFLVSRVRHKVQVV